MLMQYKIFKQKILPKLSLSRINLKQNYLTEITVYFKTKPIPESLMGGFILKKFI